VHICDIVDRPRDFCGILVALFALIASFFALAQEVCRREEGRAFQASSPKNFPGSAFGSAPFFAFL